MPFLPALVASGLVLVYVLLDELRGVVVVCGDGGRDGVLVEDLTMHLTHCRDCVDD